MTAPGLYPEHDIFHSVDETEEHASLDERRATDCCISVWSTTTEAMTPCAFS